MTVLYLDEGGRTVSVFAEHAAGGTPSRDVRNTFSLARASRYLIAEAVSSGVFAGQAEFVRDAQSDARFEAGPDGRWQVLNEHGVRRRLYSQESRMDPRRGARLTVRLVLLSEPSLWCWEIVDTVDGTIVESSWTTNWTGYKSSPEALRAGISGSPP